MKKTTTIHVRIPSRLKKSAQKVAEANGLDLSSCIRVFLTHMDVRGTMPLPSLTVNGFTEEEEEELLRRMGEPTIPIDGIKAFIDSCKP
ncbi:type II toxin-antitoxin system RelB/DinJ family antitoxin [Candidatus Peregrinibacteria bacterium]|nr:type II toxin-antitoxin system RelB/DinJ family antitoxin [Candidatus Peregrinibacteria bacterium]MBI3816326.1 type II toxin-antitoxin system RelB/DinJ family antitoxin [Candidatus Peregrinibacteria bacterium]